MAFQKKIWMQGSIRENLTETQINWTLKKHCLYFVLHLSVFIRPSMQNILLFFYHSGC